MSADGYTPDKEFPQPVFVGCDRKSSMKIGFIGDSITQGLGTREDEYEYWVAVFGRTAGNNFSVYNMGLGCARASDAASDGVWLKRAKQMDFVFVCFGINDIFTGSSAEKICADIEKTVDLLKASGDAVGLLSDPTFDMTGDDCIRWYGINEYIGKVISKKCNLYLDTADVLGRKPPESHQSLYGSHPDGNGGKALGKALYKKFKKIITAFKVVNYD